MAKKFSLEALVTLADGVTKPMVKMETAVGKFGKNMKKNFGGVGRDIKSLDAGINKAAKGIGIGIVALGAVAVVAANKATEEWGIAQAAIASVQATLTSTGGTVGRTLEQLQAQASSIQKNTFIGDDAVMQGVTAQMLTFTNITGKAFDRAQIAVVDVAAKLNGLNTTEESLKSTTIALSKALNDPVANLGALSRSGIQFSKVQKNMIASMVKNGKLFEAQDLILTEIEKQYGGTAVAITKTTAGLKLQADNLQGDAWEELGKAIEPVVQKLLYFKEKVIEKITPLIQKFGSYIEANMGKISAAIDKIDIEKIITNFIEWGKSLKAFIDFVVFFGPALIGMVVAIKAITLAMTIYNAVMWLVSLNPMTLTILAIAAGVGLLTAAVIWMVKNWALVVLVLKNVGSILMTTGQMFLKYLLTPVNLVIDAISALLGILSHLPGVGDFFKGAQDGLDKFQNTVNKTLTGSEGTFDYKGTIQAGEEKRAGMNAMYANPATKGSESRTYAESKTTNEVVIRAEKGTSIMKKSGVPSQYLSYGSAQ